MIGRYVEEEMFTLLGIVVSMGVAVLVMVLANHMNKWKRTSCQLPAGSIGWPLVGEGLFFMKPRQVGSLGDFLEHHISRFGKTFTTNLFGKLTIVTVDEDMRHFISQNDMKAFDSGFPNYIRKLVSDNNIAFASVEQHKQQRSFTLNFLRREKLETSILVDIEHAAKKLITWEDGSIISAIDEVKKFTFSTVTNQTLGLVIGDLQMDELRKLYDSIVGGFTTSFPLNLPGTTYNKALHARTQILNILEQEIDRRMQSKEVYEKKEENDLIDWLINNTDYSRERTSNFIYGLILGGYITVPDVLAMAIYLLGRCPKAIEQLREEHQRIIQSQIEKGGNILTWEHYKSMEFTQCVLNETMRLMGGSYFSRVANRDIEYKGYMIPSGCKILSATAGFKYFDPAIYEDPKSFNPWRWLGPSGIQSSKNFTPFGKGPRQCPGAKFASLENAIFLHHFILKYNWKLTNPNLPTLTSQGFAQFPGGLPIKLEALRYMARE